MATCNVDVQFEDELLGEPIRVTLNCSNNSRKLGYYLRKAIQNRKFVAAVDQELQKLSDKKYLLRKRDRNYDNLQTLTVHGHHYDEYKLKVSPADRVIDLKFLLAPLIDAKPEDIQLNYNTLRKLNDPEKVSDLNILSNDSIIIMWWLELENNVKGQSSIYRTVSHLATTNPLFADMGTIIRKTCQKYGSTINTFGVRKYLNKNSIEERGDFEYINYDIINDKISNIAAAFRFHLQLQPQKSMIGLCARNRREWLLCDYAASIQSLVTIPLYATLDVNSIEYICNHANIECVIVDSDKIEEIYNLRKNGKINVKTVILMDYELPDILLKEKHGNYFDFTLTQIEEIGTKYRDRYVDNIPSENDLYTIMYTSGTTGNPKGVMITHKNAASTLMALSNFNPDIRNNVQNPVHLSYLPLAHILERITNLWSLMFGRKIGFFCGDNLRLIEDMNILKPQLLIGVPRIFQKIQDQITQKINSSNFLIQKFFNYAYQSKLASIHKRQDPSFLVAKFFGKFRDAFGGDIRQVGSGGAPLSKETAEFLKICIADEVTEGYGLTEVGIATMTHEFDLKYGHVGTPDIHVEIKLVDVPEMQYLTTDKPVPRGEIWMRGCGVFKGYYKNKNKTNEVLNNEGWFASGDIGLWREEGRLQIIDRKKNIFKLSQGEYVRPEYIQNIYRQSKYVANAYVYGDSLRRFLVGIIVPDFEMLKISHPELVELIDKHGSEEACKNEMIMNLIKNDIKLQEDKVKLNGFERVKKFRLVTDDFTVENGLLTTSMKLKRNTARKRFQNDISDMYKIRSKM